MKKTIKLSVLREYIRERIINVILEQEDGEAEGGKKFVSPEFMQMVQKKLTGKVVKNPETGREVLITTAMSYGKDHPAYRKAKPQIMRAYKDVQKEMDNTKKKLAKSKKSGVPAKKMTTKDKIKAMTPQQKNKLKAKVQTIKKQVVPPAPVKKTKKPNMNAVINRIKNNYLEDDV